MKKKANKIKRGIITNLSESETMKIYEEFYEFLTFIQPRTTQISAHCMPVNESSRVCAFSDTACMPDARCRRPVCQDKQPQAQKRGTAEQRRSVQ